MFKETCSGESICLRDAERIKEQFTLEEMTGSKVGSTFRGYQILKENEIDLNQLNQNDKVTKLGMIEGIINRCDDCPINLFLKEKNPR